MSDAFSNRQGYRLPFRLRAIANRILKLSCCYVLIGVLISTLDAQISQPGMIAWTLVLGVYGAVIGILGGVASHVLLVAAGTAALFLLTSIGVTSTELNSADATAGGLLLGAIAGGLFRPWFRLSLGLLRFLGNSLRSLVGSRRTGRNSTRTRSGVPANPNADRALESKSTDAGHRKAA